MEPSKPIILLVDDDRADQQIIKRIVDQGGLSATLRVVSSGKEALDYLGRNGAYTPPADAPTPSLILLDLNMPGMSGLDLLSVIRNNPQTKLLPIVILTTSDQESDIVQSYERGANSYLTKPIKYDEFVRVIRELDEYWFDLTVLPPVLGKEA